MGERSRVGGAVRVGILAGLVGAGLAGVLWRHWEMLGEARRDPRFVRFARRYAGRAAEGVAGLRARALDCRGEEFEPAEEGSEFRRVLDDLAVSAGTSEVELTIDGRLQARAEELLAGRAGAVVAIEPSTGKVRALASSPRSAGLNRALNGLYPPGSVFKVFMAAAAVSAGVEPALECGAGGYRSARGTPAIRDWQEHAARRAGKAWRGLGRIGMGEALMRSANTYFAQLGVRLGAERFAGAVERARLREGVELARSGAGSLTGCGATVPEGLRAAELAATGIGQGGLQFTPLGVAMVTAAVANDGVMVKPSILKGERAGLRAVAFPVEAAMRVKGMMRAAVRGGTGRGCEIAGMEVCGKTGTAQAGDGRGDHAWFTCFAPERAPRIAVTVLVEHGGGGGAVAAPIAREMLIAAREAGYL